MLERLQSLESPFRDAYRHARKHPRATLGAAAGTAAAVIGVTAGVSAAATPAQHPAAAPFPTAHTAPLAPAKHGAAPALSPSAPAPATADHSATHSAAAVRQQPKAPKAAVTLAPARQQTAPGKQAKAVVVQHVGRGQGNGKGNGHRAWHAVQANHARGQGHQHAKKQWPYLIYDSVTPTAIPSHHVVATYATGPYAASQSDVAGRKAILWIDTRGYDPHAAALDVEPGDATPSMAASWAWHRLHVHPNAHAIIYTMRSEWAAAQSSIGTLPHWMQHHVRWWIADPTGYPHVVPGSNATQWYWGTHYDITTANPGF